MSVGSPDATWIEAPPAPIVYLRKLHAAQAP